MSVSCGREMPRYTCIKKVHALKIAKVGKAPLDQGGARLISYADDGYAATTEPGPMFARYVPKPGDYLVVYEDGYRAFSPAKAFEQGYVSA